MPVPAVRPQVRRRVRRRPERPAQGGVLLGRLRRPRPQAGQLQVQEGAHVGHVHQDVQGEVPQPGIQVRPKSRIFADHLGSL